MLGFRKIDAHSGSWIARMRDESGAKTYNALGLDTPQFGSIKLAKLSTPRIEQWRRVTKLGKAKAKEQTRRTTTTPTQQNGS